MLTPSRWAFVAAIAMSIAFAPHSRAQAQSDAFDAAIESVVRNYLAGHPEEIEKIVREYLAKHPEVIQPAILDFIQKRVAANKQPAQPTPDRSAAVQSNAATLFDSAHQVTLGNPQGDVTLVEFFDYNCGYCKRALADTIALLETEPRLKLVLKEFPVLGPASTDAARVAIAVRMQDPAGARYLEFHRKLLGSRTPSDKASALAAARDAGFDVARLEQDMTSDEVRATLEENFALAKALGINGTPSYVVGDTVVIGAVGLATLKNKVAERH